MDSSWENKSKRLRGVGDECVPISFYEAVAYKIQTCVRIHANSLL